jgi:hypothetical protein
MLALWVRAESVAYAYAPYKVTLQSVEANHGHCESKLCACYAGSFTDWQNPVVLRRSSETKDFIRTIALQPGTYQVIAALLHLPVLLVQSMWGSNRV